MPTLYLSRVRLRRDTSLKALLPLLIGDGGRQRAQQPGHHLIWALFADAADRERDFLWRQMEIGTFLILSARKPQDRHAIFDVDEPKRFAPNLVPGDRLRFSLRANPVVRRRRESSRSTKHDVVMDALRALPSGARAGHRLSAIRKQGLGWLQRQGDRAGFEVRSDDVQIDGYQQHRIGRKNSSRSMTFSTLDFDGLLVVRDPEALLRTIMRGFGSAKSYGCGLMLIRRA